MLQFGAKTVISGNSTLLSLCPWLDELRKRKGEKSIDTKGEGSEIQLSRLRIHFDDFLADRPSTVSEGRDPARDARRPLGVHIRLSLFLCECHNSIGIANRDAMLRISLCAFLNFARVNQLANMLISVKKLARIGGSYSTTFFVQFYFRNSSVLLLCRFCRSNLSPSG